VTGLEKSNMNESRNDLIKPESTVEFFTDECIKLSETAESKKETTRRRASKRIQGRT